MKKAIWVSDYDFHTDRIYKCPGCPECREPVFQYEEGFRCAACGELVEIDEKMEKWYAERTEMKIEKRDCPRMTLKDGTHVSGCGGKNCVVTYYRRNPVTLKWETAGGECSNCGMRFIV